MKAVRDRVVRDQLEFEGVIERRFVEVLREEPERAALWQGIGHRMWLYGDRIPINIHVLGDRTLIWLCDENQDGEDVIVKGLLESDHPTVVSWAESLYEEYRDEAEPLRPEVVPSK